MNAFDRMIKEKANAENIEVPEGFVEKIDRMMENITKQEARKTRRLSYRTLVLTAGLLVLSTVLTVASPIAVNMAEGAISYFNAPKEFRYLSKQAEYEKYNGEVGISCEDKGVTVTLDHIAVDDNYINIFYTLTSDEPIALRGDEDTPLKWRLQWTVPHFWFKADGKYIEPPAQGEQDAYPVDAYTMKGMQRYALLDQLKDQFELEIYTNEILDKEGQWHIAVNVDKRSVAVESTTVMPDRKATVTSGWKEKVFKHHITVKKVSISPFGSQIVLSQRGDFVFSDFALLDDQGNYLPVIPSAIGSSKLFEIHNNFEFIPKNKNMKAITLLPILSDGHSQLTYVEFSTLPIELPVNPHGSYILESIEMDEEKMVAVFHQKGPVSIINVEVTPADANKERLPYMTHVDYEYDRQTGATIMTGYWGKNVTQKDLENIKGFLYYINDDFLLNEEEAITIQLQ